MSLEVSSATTRVYSLSVSFSRMWTIRLQHEKIESVSKNLALPEGMNSTVFMPVYFQRSHPSLEWEFKNLRDALSHITLGKPKGCSQSYNLRTGQLLHKYSIPDAVLWRWEEYSCLATQSERNCLSNMLRILTVLPSMQSYPGPDIGIHLVGRLEENCEA